MKKTRIILIVLVCLIVLEVVGAGFLVLHVVRGAEQDQAAVYGQYTALLDSAGKSTLTVTEDGAEVGTYTLEMLGLLTSVQNGLTSRFSETDRMPPEAFSALRIREKLDWDRETHPDVTAMAVNGTQLNAGAVLEDLRWTIRPAAKNAYAAFTDGAFEIFPEEPGRELKEDAVLEALEAGASAMVIRPDQPAAVTLELTDYDCYQAPEITAETGNFDFSGMLSERLSRVGITLHCQSGDETLSGAALAELIQVDEAGQLEIQEDALEQFLDRCAQDPIETNMPFILDSYATGPVEIDFLTCDYIVDTEALGQLLREALVKLESTEIQVPFLCTGGLDEDGQPFELGDTYVEVDIAKQQMTFYKDGELIVHTDVVTGYRNWRETPTGFYTVQNKDTGCWLTGPDFNVYVEYWVGFIGTLYGIHDATWRTQFGGTIYARNGSHGCVNTPSEAMEVLFENIEVGTPVLVYNVKRD